MKKRIIKTDDSQARGKYHTIDLNEWEEVKCHVINDKLLGVGREHRLKEAVIYIQIGEAGRTDICKDYKLFHKQDFIEYKKERGENKFQDTKISSNGTVWVGDTEGIFNFIVFVPIRRKK
jgi:hypothetical protein